MFGKASYVEGKNAVGFFTHFLPTDSAKKLNVVGSPTAKPLDRLEHALLKYDGLVESRSS